MFRGVFKPMFSSKERKTFDRIKAAQKEAEKTLNRGGRVGDGLNRTALPAPEALEQQLRDLDKRRTDVAKLEEEIASKQRFLNSGLKTDIRTFKDRLAKYAHNLYYVSKDSFTSNGQTEEQAKSHIGHAAIRTICSEFCNRLLSPIRDAGDRIYGQLNKNRASAREDAELCRTEVGRRNLHVNAMDKEESRLRNAPWYGFAKFEIAAFPVIREEVEARAKELNKAAHILWERALTKHALYKASNDLKNGLYQQGLEKLGQAEEHLRQARERLNRMNPPQTVATENAEGDNATPTWLNGLNEKLDELRHRANPVQQGIGINSQTVSFDTTHLASRESLGDPPSYRERRSPSPAELARNELVEGSSASAGLRIKG
jgi:hypothetical protein